MKNTILERWRMVVARKGAAAAVLTPDGGVARTFAQIDAESDDIAAGLGKHPRGAVVSLQAPNLPVWPSLLLGIWKAGGRALLVDHSASAPARDGAEKLCGACVRFDGGGEVPLSSAVVDLGPVAPDLIKLTSGTSGDPRAILFTAAQLAADCDNVCETMGIGESDINHGVVAFSHSYGFSNLVTPLLCRGVPLVAAGDALPRALAGGLAATGATVLPAVPAVFQALSGLDASLPALRLCISAGAPLRGGTVAAFRRQFGLKIRTFYGASECGGITYDAGEGDEEGEGFVGNALCGVDIEPQEGGEILVRSAAVGLGYFPAADAGISGGVFKPADLLEATPRGWRIVGRRTDLINVGGRKVSPGEIEAVLLAHPAVGDAVVFGVASARSTDMVCACVVGDADEAALRVHCAERLATWQVPKSIFKVDAIPVNTRGKVSRTELARRFG